MSLKRTPTIEVDKDFEAFAEITKAYVDNTTGERHIAGVATGVSEDLDGERVSKNAIIGMGRKIQQGGVKITGSHQQDWMTEIGDIVKYEHDPETDEMIVHGVLPPEGVDPIADKAWRTVNKEKVGWSIGGKLLNCYFERNELGKKRKVLDSIDLRHIMLTKRPAYPTAFVEAVAKTFDGDAPADDQFTIDVDESVEKDTTTGSWASGDSDSGGGNVGRDSVGSGKRNAGSKNKGSKGMRTEDSSDDDSDTDGDDGKDLPKAADERHLACPNCGHEFAADLPVDPDERQVDDTNDNDDEDESGDTGKSVETPLMSKLTETIDSLRGLAAAGDVAKTDETAPEAAAVEKTATGPELSDVEKMVAVSHQANTERLNGLEARTGEGFELVAKTLQKISGQLAELPQGRKSVALRREPTVGHSDETVGKTAQERIDEAPDALTALKISNAETYGIR